MIIDGKRIADSLLDRLTEDVNGLIRRGIRPTLSVILVGDNPASLAYIRQKRKAAERIGAEVLFRNEPESISAGRLREMIEADNRNPGVHGLIVQRPVPIGTADLPAVLSGVAAQKDVDGFLPDSPFDVPVAVAVGEILRWVKADSDGVSEESVSDDGLFSWLGNKRITVIGRGETAGAPILRYLEERHCTTSLIHSGTADPGRILNTSDIIISCVGKPQVVRAEDISPGAVLVSVGIWRDPEGKLMGDYDESEIGGVAGYYTPTPGGVGPVNVACLMKNLVKACTIQDTRHQTGQRRNT